MPVTFTGPLPDHAIATIAVTDQLLLVTTPAWADTVTFRALVTAGEVVFGSNIGSLEEGDPIGAAVSMSLPIGIAHTLSTLGANGARGTKDFLVTGTGAAQIEVIVESRGVL